MNIKSTFYKEIYFVDNVLYLTDKQNDKLIMVGEKNWASYFLPFKSRGEYEIIKNVELMEFDKAEEMFEYMSNISSHFLLNFALGFEKPCLLKFV